MHMSDAGFLNMVVSTHEIPPIPYSICSNKRDHSKTACWTKYPHLIQIKSDYSRIQKVKVPMKLVITYVLQPELLTFTNLLVRLKDW